MTGKAQNENGGGYLHRGIARREFERRFSLADHMKVVGASRDNGMLSVDVVVRPEFRALPFSAQGQETHEQSRRLDSSDVMT